LHALNYVAPETIWQYGDMMPQIHFSENAYQFPSTPKFGILTNRISPEELTLIKATYNVKEIGSYDLNQAKEGSKQYNDRLTNTFYILTKK